MTGLNPWWGGVDYVLDTPPYDSLVISYTPSIASDVTASQVQLDSMSSAQSFMQSQFRAVAENMYDSGLVVSALL